MVNDFELVVIGGGIVGCCVFNYAVMNGVKAVLLEAENDVCAGASKANSGIIHSGYDPAPLTQMASLCLRGNLIYPALCRRLGVGFLPCGTLTVAPESGRKTLESLLERGAKNGVRGLRLVEKEELFAMEPNLAENINLALFAPSGGVISPYSVCIALAEEGVINGGTVLTGFRVDSIIKDSIGFTFSDGKRTLKGKRVVNCCGSHANEVNALVGIKPHKMTFLRGEYLLLDRSQKGFVTRPIFPLPTEKSKGILATVTEHGNVMFGPTAESCLAEDTRTSLSGIEEIRQKVVLSVNKPNFKKTIKLFAGVRAKSGDDFVLRRADEVENFYYALGICSPGLTAAPAIAEYMMELLQEDGLQFHAIEAIPRTPYTETAKLSRKELSQLIKQNPAYGRIVCRCERISEGEIIEALNSPLHPHTIDAIKRRVRPTMGRCQGSFCIPKLLKIFARHQGLPQQDITLDGEGGSIVVGDIKDEGFYKKSGKGGADEN